jgi:SAM-dependent methyltransferase
MEQRFTFDAIAALYDAARPDYPDALFVDVAAIAGLAPDDSILEIGCGTGRATQALARWGAPVLALDPGPALLDVARRRLAAFPNVRFAEATFEAWPLEPDAFGLVAAAQSWHWVAPHVRFVKAAAALKAGGFLAVFGNVAMPIAGPLGPALDRVFARYAPRFLEATRTDWYLPHGEAAKTFAAAESFGPAIHRRYPWTRRHSASDYVALMRTWSHFQLLGPAVREALAVAAGETIDAQGGALDVAYEAHL